jgi:hypothetical protein
LKEILRFKTNGNNLEQEFAESLDKVLIEENLPFVHKQILKVYKWYSENMDQLVDHLYEKLVQMKNTTQNKLEGVVNSKRKSFDVN